MRRFPFPLLAAVVFFAGAPMALQAQDEEAVLAALHAFHAAHEAGDGEAALALLAPDARILEGGNIETKDHYASGHLAGDMAFAQAVTTTRSNVTVRVAGDVAWVGSTSTRQGEYRGRQIDSRGGELAVLVRLDGEWKIAAVSWSSAR